MSRAGVVRFTFASSRGVETGILSLRTQGLRTKDRVLGSSSFRAGTGPELVVRVPLTAGGRAAVKRMGRVKVRATIIVRDADGNATVKTFRFTLVRAK